MPSAPSSGRGATSVCADRDRPGSLPPPRPETVPRSEMPPGEARADGRRARTGRCSNSNGVGFRAPGPDPHPPPKRPEPLSAAFVAGEDLEVLPVEVAFPGERDGLGQERAPLLASGPGESADDERLHRADPDRPEGGLQLPRRQSGTILRAHEVDETDPRVEPVGAAAPAPHRPEAPPPEGRGDRVDRADEVHLFRNVLRGGEMDLDRRSVDDLHLRTGVSREQGAESEESRLGNGGLREKLSELFARDARSSASFRAGGATRPSPRDARRPFGGIGRSGIDGATRR